MTPYIIMTLAHPVHALPVFLSCCCVCQIPPTLVSAASGELLSSFPIYVAVPPHEVKTVIESIADKDKRNDLVFLHPACLETVLKRYGTDKAQ